MNHVQERKLAIEIIGEPIRFQLHGLWSVVENQHYAEVGLRLMNEIWQALRDAKIQTTGINHWVYMPGGRMFVGVAVKNGQEAALPDRLEPFAFELRRYLKHMHIGPYQALPQKWQDLQAELRVRGETSGFPSLEVYGHACEDPSQAETTILIGLAAPG